MTDRIRVAFPMRVDALDKPGGDVVLVRRYIEECAAQALEGNVTFEGEILTTLKPDLSTFDVVHLTNIDRPVDTYSQFLAARRFRKPVVFTPIHHSYREIERYEKAGRKGLLGSLSGHLTFSQLELLRSIWKARRYADLRHAMLLTLRRGITNAQRDILLNSNFILPAGEKEISEIAHDFCELPARNTIILRNGSEGVSYNKPAPPRDIDVCVIGRIEARKNQLAILEALNHLGLQGTFAGAENPNHPTYCKQFKQAIAASQSTYLGPLSHREALTLMRRSRVHVAASWFEVSSQADIEAYGEGCRVVASQCGATHEVLGDDAYYVDPSSPADIAEKIATALRNSHAGITNSRTPGTDNMPTWRQLGKKLLDLYCSLKPTAAS